MDKMALFNKDIPNSGGIDNTRLPIINYNDEHIGVIFLSAKGQIILEFVDGTVIGDEVSILFDPSLSHRDDCDEKKLRVYYGRFIDHWVISRLQLLSVIYRNKITVSGSMIPVSEDIFYEFKDKMHSLAPAIVELARQGSLSDKASEGYSLPSNECVKSVEELVNLDKGMHAKLTVRLKADKPVSYLGWFRGYYLQVSDTDDGKGDAGHSSRIYPDMEEAIRLISRFSLSIASQYLKIQVIECLSEARFNLTEIVRADDKINAYIQVVLSKVLEKYSGRFDG
jgi:hypothetical protein